MKLLLISKTAAIALLGQISLLIIFRNLPFPFSSFYFYFIIFIISLLISQPSVLISHLNKYTIIFGLYFSMLFLAGVYRDIHNDYNILWFVKNEFIPIFLSTSLFTYFIKNQNNKSIIIIIVLAVLFYIISSMTSIWGLIKYPLAARELSGMLVTQGKIAIVEHYQKRGIASYPFYYGVAFGMPLSIMILKKHWHERRNRMISLLTIFIFLSAILLSQLTTAFLFLIIGIIYSLITVKSYSKSLKTFLITMLLILIIPNQFYAGIVKGIAFCFQNMLYYIIACRI